MNELNAEETYLVHNLIMEQTHRELIEHGRVDLAEQFQKMAQDRNEAFILHSLIHTTLELAYLDQETEPEQ